MKFYYSVLLLVLSITFSMCLAQTEKQKMLKIASSCKITTKASDDDIAMLLLHKVPPSHEGKCLFSCIADGLEIVSCGYRNKNYD
jgi:PBP/GOBP family